MSGRLRRPVALLVVAGALATLATPPQAQAFDPTKPICALAGLVSTLAGKVCSTARDPGRVLTVGKKLLGGHLGAAVQALSGSTAGSTAARAIGLAAIGAWVAGGARLVLHQTAAVIATTTRPQLDSTWFSATYWRMAAISALLTLPFLFAAAIQALLRSDMAMLARSALGYLPLGLLACSIAAPVTMLLLSASDELSAIVSSASGGAGGAFLSRADLATGGLTAISGSTFLLFFVGLLTVAATITLWVELLIRSAAVYVVVMMLPLFFAALVWPARRVWAMRAVEVLAALILSKFVIVAVLSLGGAALGHTVIPSATQMLAGATLVMLAAFAPWALLRLLPLHELASGLDGLRAHSQPLTLGPARATEATEIAEALVRELPVQALKHATVGPTGGEAALRGLAANSGGSGGSGADDGATNGAIESRAVDGAGPQPPPSPAPSPPGSDATPPSSAPRSSAPPSSEPDPASDPGAGQAERLPGTELPWQADDFRSRTLVFGPDSPPFGQLEPEPPTDDDRHDE